MNQPLPILSAILNRRSVGRLSEPGPSREQLETIIKAGTSAPDHGHLRPWKFIVFQGDARLNFGVVLAEALKNRLVKEGLSATDRQIEKERAKFLRAPVVIGVCSVIDDNASIPAIEQFASTAAACENMLIAATALGLGSMWRTGEPSYDDSIKSALNLKATDMIAGWLYFGSAQPSESQHNANNKSYGNVSYWT